MKKIFFIALIFICSTTSFAQDRNSITLRANIANRKGDVIRLRDKYFDYRVEIVVNSQGYFEYTFKLEDGLYRLYDDVDYTEIYLEKGYNVTINIDDDKFAESVVCTGDGAKENNYLAKYYLDTIEFRKNHPQLFDLGEAEFRNLLDEKKASDLKRLHENKLNKKLVALQEKNIDIVVKENLDEYLEKAYKKKIKNTIPPSCDFINSNGENAKLEDFKGKYLYVTLWNNRPLSNFKELSFLNNLEEQYHDKNIAFVFVTVDGTEGMLNWKRMIKSGEVKGVHLFARDFTYVSPFISYFKLKYSFPRFIILDPDGRIVDADADIPSCPEINSVLESLLK